jgi:Bacteriophage protein GP30.3
VTLNIASYSDDWRSRLLSTFAHTPFDLMLGDDRVHCESVEGFWQGLKWPAGSADRARVFRLWGLEAKLAGAAAPIGEIDVAGRGIPRGSPAHHELAGRAMRAKLEQNPAVQDALRATAGLRLTHELIDEHGDPVVDSLTLPKAVFVDIWMRLRDEITVSAHGDAPPP